MRKFYNSVLPRKAIRSLAMTVMSRSPDAKPDLASGLFEVHQHLFIDLVNGSARSPLRHSLIHSQCGVTRRFAIYQATDQAEIGSAFASKTTASEMAVSSIVAAHIALVSDT